MRCPKCYGRVEKLTNICMYCGFNMKKLQDASNKKAKEMKRQGDGDLCIETTCLPKDVSKKKLILLSSFLGLFGAHYFYIGKMFRGLLNLVFTIFMFVFATLRTLNIRGGIFEYVEFFVAFGFIVVLLCTILDVIKIIRNKFKVPVYIDEE